MALQKTITLSFSNMPFVDAYWRIEQFEGNRNFLTITVQAYEDAASAVVDPDTKNTARPPLPGAAKSFLLPTPNTSSNMFASAYDYLKTQEFFIDSTDV